MLNVNLHVCSQQHQLNLVTAYILAFQKQMPAGIVNMLHTPQARVQFARHKTQPAGTPTATLLTWILAA